MPFSHITGKKSALAAVIDIGSNSVRMVVYDGIKRVPLPLFNEKVLCGLAKHIEKTGKLDEEAMAKAHQALARFLVIAQTMHVETMEIVATAAVRDAQDGKAFVQSLENAHNIKIRTITGDEEAAFSGLGVASSIPDADGLVGDLGGGSLELIDIKGPKLGDRESMKLGILRLFSKGLNPVRLTNFINEHLDQSKVIANLRGRAFYAVGGGFRTLAKVHMHRKMYPLRIVDRYTMKTQDFLDTLDDVQYMTNEQLATITSISEKRVDMLPITAMIAKQIIEYGKPRKVVFCTNGLREGVLFSKLSAAEQKQDPLIVSVTEMLERVGRDPDYGHMLMEWLNPLFPEESESHRVWRLAACILSEYSCYEHTEYRAELAFRRFLDASVSGADHKARVFIATALYHRYEADHLPSLLDQPQILLSSQEIHHAQIIGIAMKLAHDLSGGYLGMMDKVHLEMTNKKLILFFVPEYANLVGRAVYKRLSQLAELMGKKAELVIGDEVQEIQAVNQ